MHGVPRTRTAWYYSDSIAAEALGLDVPEFRKLVKANSKHFNDLPRDERGGWHPDVLEVCRVLLGWPSDPIGEARELLLEELDGSEESDWELGGPKGRRRDP